MNSDGRPLRGQILISRFDDIFCNKLCHTRHNPAMLLRFSLVLLFATVFSGIFCVRVSAQQEAPIYKGLRISLFDFSIKKLKSESVTLQLAVANTGRLPVAFGKRNQSAPEQLVIELDTVNLPVILHGREGLVTDAVRNGKFELAPGEMASDVSVEINLDTSEAERPEPTSTQPDGICPDLVFDTAYITQYKDNSIVLRFLIRNAGNTSARLLGISNADDDNLAVNVYFVSGTKLTRGAILADGVFIRKGQETLDGVLQPGQILEGDLTISLANRSRFTPNLIFELDPFQTVNDCDRTNNTKSLMIEF